MESSVEVGLCWQWPRCATHLFLPAQDLEKCSDVLMHQIEGLNAQAAAMSTSLESLEHSIASEQLSVVELKTQLQRVQGTARAAAPSLHSASVAQLPLVDTEFGQKGSQEYQQFLGQTAEQILAAQVRAVSPLPPSPSR